MGVIMYPKLPGPKDIPDVEARRKAVSPLILQYLRQEAPPEHYKQAGFSINFRYARGRVERILQIYRVRAGNGTRPVLLIEPKEGFSLERILPPLLEAAREHYEQFLWRQGETKKSDEAYEIVHAWEDEHQKTLNLIGGHLRPDDSQLGNIIFTMRNITKEQLDLICKALNP